MPELRGVPLAELRLWTLLKPSQAKPKGFTMEINFPNKGFPRTGEAVTAGD